MFNRDDYKKFSTEELSRRYRSAEDRSTRADTMDDVILDMYVMQEIGAVLKEREVIHG